MKREDCFIISLQEIVILDALLSDLVFHAVQE